MVSKLEQFVLYETTSRMYLVGCDKLQSQYRCVDQTAQAYCLARPCAFTCLALITDHDVRRVLKIDRRAPLHGQLADICSEDPTVYSPLDIIAMLDMIHEGNKSSGGLRRVSAAVGIVGFVRFLGCFYLTLITARKRVGAIRGNMIYAVSGTETFPIRRDASSAEEESAGAMSGPVQQSLPHADPQLPHNTFVNVWSKVRSWQPRQRGVLRDETQALMDRRRVVAAQATHKLYAMPRDLADALLVSWYQ